MEQDTEYMKLPLEERCTHKVYIVIVFYLEIFVVSLNLGKLYFYRYVCDNYNLNIAKLAIAVTRKT